MKFSGNRFFLVCFLALIFMAVPVYGDLATPTITHVYFTKDGIPWHESVRYTVSCYGFNGWNPTYQFYQRPAAGEPGHTGEVFRYSATCPDFGCTIYEPYYHVRYMDIDWCDLGGETRGTTFTVRNFSTRPFSTCTGMPEIPPYPSDYPQPGTYLQYTPEYYACDFHSRHANMSVSVQHRVFVSCDLANDTDCFTELLPDGRPLRLVSENSTMRNATALDQQHLVQYLETCNPVSDPDCPGTVIDGRPLKAMLEFRPFRNASIWLKDPCFTFLAKANPALFIPPDVCNMSECDNKMAESVCDLRAAIPAENRTGISMTMPEVSPYIPLSPVESLYCSILQLFGGGCE
jgi:hypothetical protein